MSSHHFYIGVDGGATKTIVRVEDEKGKLLGLETSGPANIRISVNNAWHSIQTALDKILYAHGIDSKDSQVVLHAGMGLAGCEIQSAYQAFIQTPHIFTTLVVSSDAHTACLGAHAGSDGAIIIVGTGVVGYQIDKKSTTKVGGHGFPHDDIGGGAWLGLSAVTTTLQWLDGRSGPSGLAQAVYEYFSCSQDKLVNWANTANSSGFAQLAPLVIQQSQVGDATANDILQLAAKEIDRMSIALAAHQAKTDVLLPCCLLGGIAPFIAERLSSALRNRLTTCAMPPDAGAILLVQATSTIKRNF